MQQAIYNSATLSGSDIALPATRTTAPTACRASLLRRIARRWNMIGVVALMGSSAAYAVYAITHVV